MPLNGQRARSHPSLPGASFCLFGVSPKAIRFQVRSRTGSLLLSGGGCYSLEDRFLFIMAVWHTRTPDISTLPSWHNTFAVQKALGVREGTLFAEQVTGFIRCQGVAVVLLIVVTLAVAV